MKAGAYVINAARGGIVNEKDLYEALVSGHIAGAAMDVSEVEPMAEENPLRTLDNVIITPHIGMYSKEAIGAVSLICAQNVAACAAGAELKFQVDLAEKKVTIDGCQNCVSSAVSELEDLGFTPEVQG